MKLKYTFLLILILCCSTDIWAQTQKPPINAALITIDGEINEGLALHVENSTKEALQRGASTIIYKIDTFGGRVDSALKICDSINTKPEDRAKPKTIAWVKTRAISAGALISMSCDEIVMVSGAQIGDCQPIVSGRGVPTPAGEKIETVLRSQFRSFARRNGYPLSLAESFVDQSIEVYSFEYEGKKLFLSKKEFEDLSQIKQGRYTKKRTIIAKGKLLTIDNTEAIELGFSKATLETLDEVKKHYHLNAVQEIIPTWSERLTRYLTSSGVTSLILMIGLVAMWTEFKIPGFGVPGITALFCFTLLLGARYLSGIADMPYILMVVAGISLIIVEIFILPGTMAFGITGFALFILGFFLSFTGGKILPDTAIEMDFVYTQAKIILGAFSVSILVFLLLARFLPQIPFLNAMALETSLEPTVSKEKEEEADKFIGQIGIVVSDLRPSGKIKVNGTILDVISQSTFVNRGESVRILKKNITHFTVEHIDSENKPDT